jgi:hypothetical protein
MRRVGDDQVQRVGVTGWERHHLLKTVVTKKVQEAFVEGGVGGGWLQGGGFPVETGKVQVSCNDNVAGAEYWEGFGDRVFEAAEAIFIRKIRPVVGADDGGSIAFFGREELDPQDLAGGAEFFKHDVLESVSQSNQDAATMLVPVFPDSVEAIGHKFLGVNGGVEPGFGGDDNIRFQAVKKKGDVGALGEGRLKVNIEEAEGTIPLFILLGGSRRNRGVEWLEAAGSGGR